jgi:hypothetical protein
VILAVFLHPCSGTENKTIGQVSLHLIWAPHDVATCNFKNSL